AVASLSVRIYDHYLNNAKILIFLLMSLRPPSSTLFPYTTLFRSSANVRDGRHGFLQLVEPGLQIAALLPGLLHEPIPLDDLEDSVEADHIHQIPAPGRIDAARYVKDIVLDRKSTRLNSSHVKISYAVFCLKK